MHDIPTTTVVAPTTAGMSSFLELARGLEAQVLEHAEQSRLDPRDPTAKSEILTTIARLAQTATAEDSSGGFQLAQYVARSLLGYGPIESSLSDPLIWEIVINSPSEVFQKGLDGSLTRIVPPFFDDEHVARVITRLLDRSIGSHRKLDPSEGVQDAQLSNGSRMHIVHQDIAKGAHLLVNIRKFLPATQRTMSNSIRLGVLGSEAADFLTECARQGATMIFAGAPGSGKTTLMTGVVNTLAPKARVVCAEEVFETSLTLENVAYMQTRPRRTDRREITLRELTSAFLRMSPDAVVIGEVRDKEVLPFLMALSSGVQGFTTCHSRSARHALTRLRFLSQLSGAAITEGPTTQLVSEAVDLVVYLERKNNRVRVKEIVAVEDPQYGRDSWSFVTNPVFEYNQREQSLSRTPGIPLRLLQKFDGLRSVFGSDSEETQGSWALAGTARGFSAVGAK